jgi:proliferating cell nuclear antigen
MFEARLTQSSTLKKIVEAIRDLLPQANFDCSADGISLQGMDESHVTLVTMSLRSQAFEMFRCDRSLSLGIHLGNFCKVLKCAGNDDSVKITADDDGPDCAEFMFENASGDRVAHFQLKLMDIDSEHMNVPDDDYDTTIQMPSSEYRRIFSDLSVIGDTVTIEASKQTACFSVDGDIGLGALNIHQSDSADDTKDRILIDVKEPIKATYPGRYLLMYTKACPIATTVSLFLKEDSPLAVEFVLPEEHGYVRFFLAPKIEDSDVAPEPEE